MCSRKLSATKIDRVIRYTIERVVCTRERDIHPDYFSATKSKHTSYVYWFSMLKSPAPTVIISSNVLCQWTNTNIETLREILRVTHCMFHVVITSCDVGRGPMTSSLLLYKYSLNCEHMSCFSSSFTLNDAAVAMLHGNVPFTFLSMLYVWMRMRFVYNELWRSKFDNELLLSQHARSRCVIYA